MIKSTIVKDLSITIFINDGLDLPLKQVGGVMVDCETIDGRMTVTAPFGIKFSSASTVLELPDNVNITDYCDTEALAKQLAEEQAERDEMKIHTSGHVGLREWHQVA